MATYAFLKSLMHTYCTFSMCNWIDMNGIITLTADFREKNIQ